MAIIKCENCNRTMIPRKDYYECPICHKKQGINDLSETISKDNKKQELLNFIKEGNNNDVLLVNMLTKICMNVGNDALVQLLFAYIERETKPEILKQEIEKYFSCEEEKSNFEYVIKYLVDNCEYKFIIVLDNCVNSLDIYNQCKDYISNKIKSIEEEIEKTSLVNPDVFVCYSSNDLEQVVPIIDEIESSGFKCWYADRNIPKNHPTNFDYKKNIEEAIFNSKIFLLFASKNSMYSIDVQWEMDKAIEYGRDKRVEYVISSLKHTPRFKDFFDGVQWIDATNSNEIEVLVERLHYLMSNKNDEAVVCSAEETEEIDENDTSVESQETYESQETAEDEDGLINQCDIADISCEEVCCFENSVDSASDQIGKKELGVKSFYNGDYDNALLNFSETEIDSEINYYLAKIYTDESKPNYDIDKAYLAIINCNDSRISELSNDVGKKYITGNNCSVDFEKAFKCFQKSACFGNSKALFNVAICYQNGKGVEKDLNMALKYFKESADIGNVRAMYYFGNESLNISSDIYNVANGIKYLTMAGECGDAEAQYRLGVCYYKGIGTNINYNQSIEWLDKAIANGSMDAMDYKDRHFNKEIDYSNDNCALELDDFSDL